MNPRPDTDRTRRVRTAPESGWRNGRSAIRTLLVLVAAAACDSAISGTGDALLTLLVSPADGVSFANIDQGQIRIEGPSPRGPLSIAPGSTQTIEGLLPGTYTVVLEGLTAGEVETYGERTGVNVVAGRNTAVTVTMTSFIPTLTDVATDVTAGQALTIAFNAVTGAAEYIVQWTNDPTFANVQQTTVTASPATITLDEASTYRVRVRARNRFGSLGVPSAEATITATPPIEPLNDYIAFSSNQTGSEQVYVVPSTGGQEMQLTTTGEGSPDISPDGKRIAYQVPGQRIAVMNADGTGSVTLPGNGCNPDWSPDGSEIVFSGSCTVGPIYISNPDGSNRRAITDAGHEDLFPRWSPDGTQIAFDSDRSGNYDIWKVDVDGSNLQQLTVDPADDRSPTWSPDGTKIAWERIVNGVSDLWTMNPDAGWQVQVTGTAQPDGRPDWAPSREWLSISRQGEVYRYRPDGSGVVRVTDTGFSSDNALPRWGPCLDASCAPTTGQIEATVVTSGAGSDPDGYTISIGSGSSRSVSGYDLVTFVDVAPGAYTVTLSGLASNCIIAGGINTRTVQVMAGQLAQATTFEVECVQTAVNEIVVTPSTIQLGYVGASMIIYGSPFDATGQPVPGYTQIYFSSSNTSVVTVDANGRITAVSPGTATITINDLMGRVGTASVTVSSDFGMPFNSLGHTYALTSNPVSWGTAQVRARSTGGYLVAVNDATENGFLTNQFVSLLQEPLWIGLYDLNTEDVWEWTDASPDSPGKSTTGMGGFAAWGADEPNNAGGDEDCVHFDGSPAGTWNDLSCATELRGIAEWPALGPTVIESITYRNGHRYALTRDQLTRREARNLAESLGGHLVVIDDAGENDFLSNTYVVGQTEFFWTGLTDYNEEGKFLWLGTMVPTFTSWQIGEPNDSGGVEDCVQTYTIEAGTLTWNDVFCGEKHQAIIEWDSLK